MHKGHCLCGKVQITLNETFDSQIACHCISCQRWSGAPFMGTVLVKEAETKIEGEIKPYVYTGFNKDIVTRWHCPTCGSCVSHVTNLTTPGLLCIQTGNFDCFASIPFGEEINLDMKWKGLPPIPGATQYARGYRDGVADAKEDTATKAESGATV